MKHQSERQNVSDALPGEDDLPIPAKPEKDAPKPTPVSEDAQEEAAKDREGGGYT